MHPANLCLMLSIVCNEGLFATLLGKLRECQTQLQKTRLLFVADTSPQATPVSWMARSARDNGSKILLRQTARNVATVAS